MTMIHSSSGMVLAVGFRLKYLSVRREKVLGSPIIPYLLLDWFLKSGTAQVYCYKSVGCGGDISPEIVPVKHLRRQKRTRKASI
jgi:hypothetical protein